MMRRLFPHPVLWIGLTVLWLLLQQSLSVGNIVLGAAIAYFAAQVNNLLRLEKPVVRKPWAIITLVTVVTIDIIRSNVAVCWIILTQRQQPQSAGFVRIPMDLRNHTALAFLSMIVTSTPGTVWLEFDDDAGELLLHVLDLVGEDHWQHLIKNRYERRLLEIFQ